MGGDLGCLIPTFPTNQQQGGHKAQLLPLAYGTEPFAFCTVRKPPGSLIALSRTLLGAPPSSFLHLPIAQPGIYAKGGQGEGMKHARQLKFLAETVAALLQPNSIWGLVVGCGCRLGFWL